MNIHTALEILKSRKWEHPRDYGGFSPDGDYVICGRSRDSDALEESNYRSLYRDLKCEPWNARDDEFYDERPAVYDFRQGHWAVGWVETMLVREDADEDLLIRVAEIVAGLEDYCVYDEQDFSDLESEQAQDYWETLSTRERVEMLGQCGISIFAARRDYPPFELDHQGRLYERLGG